MKKIFRILFLLLFPIISFGQDTVFIKSYGQKGYNYGMKVMQTSDDGYIILGNKSGFVGNTDVYLLKTDFAGNYIWDKAFGSGEIDWAEDIITTKDHGYVITGFQTTNLSSDYNFMLLKTDSIGNMIWIKNYGGSNWDLAHSVIETPDSGYIMVGETYSFGNGNNDIYILKTNKNGDSLWSKVYGGFQNDVANDISNVHDGNFLITGTTSSFGKGKDDIYIIKINNTGDTLWTKTFGDTLDDKANAGIETVDHGIAITGSTQNFGAKAMDGFLMKLNSTGNELWTRVYGGPNEEECYDLIQKANEQYFMAAFTSSYGFVGSQDFYMLVADKNGWYINGTTFGDEKDEAAKSCVRAIDNGFAVIGTTASMGLGITNILFIKTDSLGNSNASTYTHITDIQEESALEDFSLYPNPVDNLLNIRFPQKNSLQSILIWNSIGQCVYDSKVYNNYSAKVDFSSLQEGIYIVSMCTKEGVIKKKIIHSR